MPIALRDMHFTKSESKEVEDFVLDRQIGSGRFSKVYLGFFRSTKVAIKVFSRKHSDIANNEVSILRKIKEHNCKHCARIIGYVFSSKYHVILELYTNARYSTLLDYVYSSKKSLCFSKEIIKDVLHGLRELKEIQVIHTDLKPENVVFNLFGKAVIIDFGNATTKKGCGLIQTRPYRSPESILGLRFNSATDVWSLGCMVYEIVTGTHLFVKGDNGPREPSSRATQPEHLSKDKDHICRILDLCESLSFGCPDLASARKKVFEVYKRKFVVGKLNKSKLNSLLKNFECTERQKVISFLEKALVITSSKRATPRELLDDPFLD